LIRLTGGEIGTIFPFMSEKLAEVLSASVQRLLKPLVSVLLRHGIAYGQFAEWCRKAYVDVAFEQPPLSGKKPTISSVSAITGLTRKETKRLRELGDTLNLDIDQRFNRAIKVISGWITDNRFSNNGSPLPLEMWGENSFATLVKEYSGDIPAAAMAKVLISAACVEEIDKKLWLIKKAYVPSGIETSLDKIQILGTDTSELIATIEHNIHAPDTDLFYQRKVSNYALNKEHLDEFKQLSSTKSQQLLEELNEWLGRHEIDGDTGQYVALGIYYTEYESNHE